ncbi:DUF2723 domain-containing protein, partial [Anaerolineales bacterium HSG24]|nr:DUF2723 domain-containing protein [Anaerolineales bacterium HSG24]
MQNRLSNLVSRFSIDTLISLLLFGGALYGYTITLAPTVLEGDVALFQYTSLVLGITYPTGFPLYVLLGKLWLTLFPIGETAWRMNFLSAFCSALALPLIYNAIWRLFSPKSSEVLKSSELFQKYITCRLAALVTVLSFATLPVFWRWSTVAKTYSLNILLLSLILYLLGKLLYPQPPLNPPQRGANFATPQSPLRIIYAIALLLGLSVSVHNTMLLLLPGVLLFVWIHARPISLKTILIGTGLFILPNLLYFYIPLRAEWLIAEHGRFDALGAGLVADFYQSGWAGWLNYFSAADFTRGVATDWGLVPGRFSPVYVDNLL